MFNRKLQTVLADRAHAVGDEISLKQEILKSQKPQRSNKIAVGRFSL
jgi:hypothetical protein